MTQLSRNQLYRYAQQAGFTGFGLDIIVAIAQAESGGNTQATNCNNPGGTCDRGVLQINNYWHSEVNNACAYDPGCAFKQAYRISQNGTNFTPWSTFTNNNYKTFLNPNASSTNNSSNNGSSGNGSSNSITDPTFWTGIAEHIFIFLLAIVVIIGGFVLMSRPQN